MTKVLLAGVLVFAASAAQAACVTGGSVPETLEVYSSPPPQNAVSGSLRNGQCGVEVTAHCQAPYCFVLADGLAGWVDARSLSAEPDESILQSVRYSVDTADGTASAMGHEQQFTFEIGSEITFDFTVSPPRVALPNNTMPSAELFHQDGPLLVAKSEVFVGLPMEAVVQFEQLGADRAFANLRAEGPLATIQGQLTLRRLGRATAGQASANAAPSQASVPNRADVSPPEPSAPSIADEARREQRQIPAQGRNQGVASSAAPEPVQDNVVTTAQACSDLSVQIRPILRGDNDQQRETLIEIMLSEGVATISNQDNSTCQILATRFADVGLIPERAQ